MLICAVCSRWKVTDEVIPVNKTRLVVVCHWNNGIYNTGCSLEYFTSGSLVNSSSQVDKASARLTEGRRFGSGS